MKLISLCRDMNEKVKYRQSLRKGLPVFQLLWNYYNVFGAVGYREKMI